MQLNLHSSGPLLRSNTLQIVERDCDKTFLIFCGEDWPHVLIAAPNFQIISKVDVSFQMEQKE
jgi:hypothetical protein